MAALLGLLLVDATAGSLLSVQRGNRQERLDGQLTPARTKLADLSKAFVDQETGVRGFVVTGGEEFLEPYVAGRREEERLASELHGLFEGDPALAERLRAVIRAGEDWRRSAAEPEISYRRAGDEARSVALVTSRTGKTRFDRLRVLLASLQDRVDAEADLVNDQTRRSADLANLVVVVSAVLALLLVGALSTQVQRRVLGPLRRLRPLAEAAARQPRAGKVPVPSGDPDVRAVAQSAERLRQTAVRNEDVAVRAQQALAQEGPSVAALTAELAPSVWPLPAGLLWAGRTVPAGGDVPGDVYDVFPVTGQQVGVLVADAAGHGPHAGLVALRAKHVVTGALRRGLDPAQALARLADEMGDAEEGFLTVFLATVDLPTGVLRYASAGHPAAALLHAGAAEQLLPTGPLLGPIPGAWSVASGELPPDGTLAVTTDGIADIELREGQAYGSSRLLGLLAEATAGAARAQQALDCERVIDAIFADVERDTGSVRRKDDRTVVLLHRPPHADRNQRWRVLPAVPASAGEARRLLRAQVPTAGDALLDAAELCLTELVTNAVLHGGRDELAVSVALERGVLHLQVRDGSDAHPQVLVHSASAGTGRGLALVAQLSERWGSDPYPSGGKVVWCELTEESAGRGATGRVDSWLADLGDLLDAGADAAKTDSEQLQEVLLLRYPIRLGMRAREHYRSVLRECQLMQAPLDAANPTGAAAELLVDIYSHGLRAQDRAGNGVTVSEDALLAAFTRGDRTSDLSLAMGEQPQESLAAAVAALEQLRVATVTGSLLSDQTPPGVDALDDWVTQECARQLAGQDPLPWAGSLD
ncbi:ATP-binding SpoIIE family protein phosphatase [Motilibacter deserti]|uniref:SpoIIE family protein phosphatase n=1 Tax=Motilibacter deserti TaxID=2714956 RepID=A0ABX0GYL7_9ACTN|nr:SpoIIE family protein phosphatase [Motilibacter deserti]